MYIRFARECSHVDYFYTRNNCKTSNQNGIINLERYFFSFKILSPTQSIDFKIKLDVIEYLFETLVAVYIDFTAFLLIYEYI